MKEKLEKYDLLPEYNWLINNNQGDKNPYHNNYHIQRVTEFTIIGCEHHQIEYPYVRLAATSAIFHDFNHSGGKFKNDDDNIDLAIDGLIGFYQDK
jgi:hypothetical protein